MPASSKGLLSPPDSLPMRTAAVVGVAGARLVACQGCPARPPAAHLASPRPAPPYRSPAALLLQLLQGERVCRKVLEAPGLTTPLASLYHTFDLLL